MLVIGYLANKAPFHSQLDIDPDTDSPRKIHDLLSKKAKGALFTHLLCVEDDEVSAEFEDEVDYDLSQPVESSNNEDEEDEEENPDSLHEDEPDFDIDLDDIVDDSE